jgi:DNA-directed RNA polymerase specialized sigma24 family protein
MKIETVARRMDVSSSTAKEYIRRVRAKYAAAGTPLPTKVELYQQAQRDGIL